MIKPIGLHYLGQGYWSCRQWLQPLLLIDSGASVNVLDSEWVPRELELTEKTEHVHWSSPRKHNSSYVELPCLNVWFSFFSQFGWNKLYAFVSCLMAYSV